MSHKFKVGMWARYRKNTGVIDFIDTAYIRIKLPAAPDRGNPLLLVFPIHWKEVEILDEIKR
jgi:hypothetical protein